MTNSDLVRLNKHQQEIGEKIYANTRNVTAGSIRLLDPRLCAERKLRMFCHGAGQCEGMAVDNHMAFLDEIARYGLPPTPLVKCLSHFDAVIEHCRHLTEHLYEHDFEVDGLVIKLNQFEQREAWRTFESPLADRLQVGEAEAVTRLIRSKSKSARPVRSRPSLISNLRSSRNDRQTRQSAQRRRNPTQGHSRLYTSWWKSRQDHSHIVRVETFAPVDASNLRFPALPSATRSRRTQVPIRCPNQRCPAPSRADSIFAGRRRWTSRDWGISSSINLSRTGSSQATPTCID
jgi:DNA ligase (NAD+)